jgi:hypothetical protein
MDHDLRHAGEDEGHHPQRDAEQRNDGLAHVSLPDQYLSHDSWMALAKAG